MHSVSYAAFPLANERPPEERPPWEPRTRFEVERDKSETRALNKQLGKSLSWIVDVLLQDEDGVRDTEQLKSIQLKKREALESLAYVRDVLNGGITKVEEERLWGEREVAKRRSAEVTTRHSRNLRSFESYHTAQINKPPPVAPIPLHIGESWPQGGSSSLHRPSASLSTSIPAPAQSTAMAPWHSTQPSFAAEPPVASAMPRMPSPTHATYLSPSTPSPTSELVKPSFPPALAGNRSPRLEVKHDPLGVL